MHSRPLLPNADKLLPYLKRIDESRYYSNTGPLVFELEGRLSEHFGCGVVTASSCTSGLTACLTAWNLPKGSRISVPSFTFVASASAIIASGHVPYFFDIGFNWCLDVKGRMAVCVFGRPLASENPEPEHLPIVIDGAAAFDTIKASECPTVISTHATKVFSTGEGGLILSKDEAFLKTVREILNFGIDENRNVNYFGFNGKMSEYAAAVGLAELDGWADKRARWIETKRRCKAAFPKYRSLVEGEWASNVYPIVLNRPSARVVRKMCERGMLSRKWIPVHYLKAYENFPRTDMTYTNELAKNTILLPFSIDITDEEIAQIGEALCASL